MLPIQGYPTDYTTLSAFTFHLPKELIAQHPPLRRGDSRLLHLQCNNSLFYDHQFEELPQILKSGDLLVLNDTKVIPARLYGHKSSGGAVEILIERLESPYLALAQLRSSKPCKLGVVINLAGGEKLVVIAKMADLVRLQAATDFNTIMTQQGQVPLPPYITRQAEINDVDRYQTIYAKHDGAVAAPTAGLHFTAELLNNLTAMGIAITYVTLHVGAGTFQPVRSEDLTAHVMHSEWCQVSAAACSKIHETKINGGRVVAVGTTSVRCLETAAASGQLQPYVGETSLFILPGYQFRVVDMLLTNFHLPHSTLLMLVCAFGGMQPVLSAYNHAVAARYRFFSYGDAMLIST